MIESPALSISPAKVCFFIAKAREFDVKDVVTDPGSSSNAADEAMLSVLEDHPDDPTHQELISFISALSEDEQAVSIGSLGPCRLRKKLTRLGPTDGTMPVEE